MNSDKHICSGVYERFFVNGLDSINISNVRSYGTRDSYSAATLIRKNLQAFSRTLDYSYTFSCFLFVPINNPTRVVLVLDRVPARILSGFAHRLGERLVASLTF